MKAAVREIAGQLYVDPSRRAEFIRLMNENDCVRCFESQIYRKDGSVIWISENVRVIRNAAGEVLYYEGTVEDITKRKQAEEQIEEQAALLDKTQDAITVRDLDGRIFFLEQGRRAHVRWTREEAMTSHISGLIRHDEEAYRAVLRDGNGPANPRRTTVNGRSSSSRRAGPSCATMTATRNRSSPSPPTSLRRKKSSRSSSVPSASIASARSPAASPTISNNILAPIPMSATILQKLVPEDARSLTTAIEESAQRGTDIVQQVLTFARGIEGERVALQPRHLCQTASGFSLPMTNRRSAR